MNDNRHLFILVFPSGYVINSLIDGEYIAALLGLVAGFLLFAFLIFAEKTPPWVLGLVVAIFLGSVTYYFFAQSFSEKSLANPPGANYAKDLPKPICRPGDKGIDTECQVSCECRCAKSPNSRENSIYASEDAPVECYSGVWFCQGRPCGKIKTVKAHGSK
ncbi:MAG: hypothetical protein EOM12_13870 [Verrucomicrobiae bacterium]|nr:hypothetical protein [Verrucomicrobiae bacterium]